MKSIIIVAVSSFSLISSVAFAQTCQPLSPTDYLVFSAQDIHYSNSDFEGLSGAGRDAMFSSFRIAQGNPALCEALVAGDTATLTDGNIDGGGVETGASFSLVRGTVSGRSHRGANLADVQNLSSTAWFFRNESASLAALRETGAAHRSGNTLTLSSSSGLAVYDLPTTELPQGSVMKIEGGPNSGAVINIRGTQAAIEGMDIELVGGIHPEQVIFNFPDATAVTITASGSSAFGVPGTVLAPSAAVLFYNDRITGGLYVGDLQGDGQVNYAKTRWP